jgi:cytochrome c oxidase cbb3-type subunit III
MTPGKIVATAALLTIGLTAGVRSQQPPAGVPAAGPGAGGRQGGRGAGPAGGPPPDPAAVERGLLIYTINCTNCHGANARGGGENGNDLSNSTIAFANDGGKQLGEFLKVGRPERRMPPFQLTDAQVADISAFLRAVAPTPARGAGAGRGVIPAVVVGDAKAGEAYFKRANGCTTCHSITGDLKGIGARLPVASIQGRIVLPRGTGGYPPGFSSPPSPNEAPKTVTVTQPSGEKVAGKLMWITDFNVTLVDDAGIQRTIARNGDLPNVDVKDPLQWHLDHMRTLTDKDMHDLTAYLVTLK